mmetsp:Transcript_3164/g.4315  ORF Transcript_3164/g.4315 Transcript_3164/m.4315 type:complete len:82 (-) Transcript_3164:121-366(-)
MFRSSNFKVYIRRILIYLERKSHKSCYLNYPQVRVYLHLRFGSNTTALSTEEIDRRVASFVTSFEIPLQLLAVCCQQHHLS